MKLRTAPLDDVYNELELVLAGDGRLVAHFVLRIFGFCYRSYREAALGVLRYWGRRP